jgi:hypothetical protein
LRSLAWAAGRHERPAFGLRLQTPLPKFAIEESEIAGALRAIEPPDAL